ncbi:hypothetical protein NECAME_14238 [Necator americanus]|uniref:Uncharacterized protein n=1 Tax=Necator americanus TaxID=51031 RepID=W2SNY9_NECAM|nr:hypothetical protein NECAME_14238 [Necator americanus]ETN71399.1 hypothetical protein NECAME_14238 [Necator americanus]
MPTEYTAVDVDPNTPPPYMDPTNSIAKKKSMIQHKKSMDHTGKRCEHCGQFAQQQPVVIWPAPRPHDHIRPDNTKFIGYVILIAVVIFLLFAACKYLP